MTAKVSKKNSFSTLSYQVHWLGSGIRPPRTIPLGPEIPVKAKLYSTMFEQSFSADGAVCSLKEDKEGRFDLRIDGVSHHSWFRRKKDEFMQSLGMPTRKQNKGIQL